MYAECAHEGLDGPRLIEVLKITISKSLLLMYISMVSPADPSMHVILVSSVILSSAVDAYASIAYV